MASSSNERDYRRLLGAVVAAMAACFTYYALARYRTFHHQTFDLALYTRLAYGLARGQLYSSLLDQHFLSCHAPYVLFPLGMLGRVFGTVPTLLVTQSVAMALAALPLYAAGRQLGGPRLGLAVAAAYLLHPNLFLVATYEFHPGNLALPGLAYGLLVWIRAAQGSDDPQQRRRWCWQLVAAVAWVLCCRADFGLLTGLLGIAIALRCVSLRWVGVAAAVVSLSYVVSMVLWIQPQFVPAAASSADLHFGPWGGGPLGIVRVAFQDPQRVLDHFGHTARQTYVFRALLPLGLLPLLSPWSLFLASPIFAINLISVFPTTTELYSHYLTPALPALSIGVALGMQRLARRARSVVTAWLPAWVALMGVLWGGAPWSRTWPERRGAFTEDDNSAAARALLARIPQTAPIQAPDPLLPHLAERSTVHRAPPPERKAQYVVFDVSHRRRYRGTSTLLRTTEEPRVRTWLARTDFAPVGIFGDWLLLQRGLPLTKSACAQYFVSLNGNQSAVERRLSSCLTLMHVQWLSTGIRLVLRAERPCPADLALQIRIPGVWSRVDLLFDGLLSIARLRSGDVYSSEHSLPPEALHWEMRRQLHIHLIGGNGSLPEGADPAKVPLLER